MTRLEGSSDLGWQSVAVCGSPWQSVAVRGSPWQSVAVGAVDEGIVVFDQLGQVRQADDAAHRMLGAAMTGGDLSSPPVRVLDEQGDPIAPHDVISSTTLQLRAISHTTSSDPTYNATMRCRG